ncbi:uncharacterized protein LOC112692945 [Sipha flava]|uniref:Uncharacterized protein LOC112692945 n=2 Tax=Sipha flava TaxID=143950 RepID=A0A8B8GMD1_9HEMI|nr:uncharacterized protein LOC112692945 [Sipha flava]
MLKCSACKLVFHRRCLDDHPPTGEEQQPTSALPGRADAITQTTPIVCVEIVATGSSGSVGRRMYDAKPSRDDSLDIDADSVAQRLHRYFNRQEEDKRSLKMEIDMLYEIIKTKHRRIKELENNNVDLDL